VKTAAPLVPARPSFRKLAAAASGCRACPLWRTGTQTVFGEGPVEARVMLVGEQPGNDEDLAGRPFVGPAGRVLDRALERAGIARGDVYLTNAVKHFKWIGKGKRRLHARPNTREMVACLPWLEAELALVQPRILVCLGATAAQALLGPGIRVTQARGQQIPSPRSQIVTVTVHPSSVLRAPDDEARHEAMAAFVRDLRRVAGWLRRLAG
jgi:DNA polymerase